MTLTLDGDRHEDLSTGSRNMRMSLTGGGDRHAFQHDREM